MTIHEAILLGGPADGRVMATPRIEYQIKVAQIDPEFRFTMTPEAAIEPLPIHQHVYEPVRTITVYEHRGTR